MRIYGSSPLYNYVELIFRCKRLFIVAIILGTLITSTMVYMRAAKYQSSMIILTTGRERDSANAALMDPREATALALQKVNRFNRYVRNTPDFLPQALKDAGLDAKYGSRFDSVVKEARNQLSVSTPSAEREVQINLNWKDPKEAVDILNAVFNSFKQKSIDEDMAVKTGVVQILQRSYDQADRDASVKAEKRVTYLRDRYWVQPALLGASMGNLDSTDGQIASVRLDMNDASVRLGEIARQLQTTPRMVNQGEEVTSVQEDPALRMISERQDLQMQLKQLTSTYSDLHPKVVEVRKKIADLDDQIKAVRSGKPVPTSQQVRTNKIINPAWQELKQQQAQLTIAMRAQERRLSELQSSRSKFQSRVMQMPREEVDFNKIQRECNLAEIIRDNLQNRLMAAKIDADQYRQRMMQELEIEMPATAEKLDSGGKVALLYVMGPILGLIIAFAFSLGLESMDHTLRTPVEVERFLGKPVLAVIPRSRPEREDRKKLAGSSKQSISS